MDADTTHKDARATLMIVFYRSFDIRLMLSTGMIKRLAQDHNIVVVCSPELIPLLRGECGENVQFEVLRYKTSKSKAGKQGLEKSEGATTLSQLLKLTYGIRNGRRNITRVTHINAYLNTNRDVGALRYKLRYFVIGISGLACRFKFLRVGLLKLAYRLETPDKHSDLFKKYKPAYVIVFSIGVSLDMLIMREARKHNIPTISFIQSWDKTSTKGYSGARPNKVIVWNHIMEDESQTFHDIPKKDIFVGGVPQWDRYFQYYEKPLRETFFEEIGLNSANKTIYYALSSPSYHKGNFDVITFLAECIHQRRFGEGVQLLLRMHPIYLEPSEHRNLEEIRSFLQQYDADKTISVSYPRLIRKQDHYLLAPENDKTVHNILTFSDVCISVASTQMIEAAIFDKPVISIEYGQWKSNTIYIDFKDFRLEHLDRIFDVGAIQRPKTLSQVFDAVKQALENPRQYEGQRKALVDRLIPVNRGTAVQVISDWITNLVRKRNRNA